jgi:hypothetical protein
MIIVLIATILSVLGVAIAHGMGNWEQIKANWQEHRCNPMYMPVAEWIRPDVSGSDNFLYCTNTFATSVWSIIQAQINVYFKIVADSIGELASPLSAFRNVIANIRGFLFAFMAQTMSKAAGSTSVFLHYLAKIRDAMQRFAGQGYIGAYLVQVLVDFVWAFVTLFISIIKTFVFALLAISIILALFQPALLVLAIVLASLIASSGF